jgi:hypothetical protein
VRIGNFTDYEREFGGLYTSGQITNHVAYAVNQFFLNGGSDAYVVGLKATYINAGGTSLGEITAPQADIGGVRFTAREPTDSVPMTVTIDNLRNSPGSAAGVNDMADLTIIYGTRVETLRGVSLSTTDENAANFITERLGTAGDELSTLVTVSPVAPPTFGTTFTAATQTPLTSTPPPGFVTTFAAANFIDAFKQDSSLDKVAIFNLLVIPGVADNSIWSNALAFAERKQAFVILDPPANAGADSTSPPPTIGDAIDSIPKSTNGALYFPYLEAQDPLTGQIIEQPPSGYVAGIYARTDLTRGVWKAPAGLETIVRNTTGLVERGKMADFRHGIVNPKGVNVLRSFPGIGTVVFGARTLVTQNNALQQWRYVPVRRMALFIEQTLYRELNWVIFEPNDEPLWIAIRTSIENFMLSLFSQGAFQGRTPSQAFLVKCDSSTTTQTDIDLGIVNILVGFRPLKPAEFVIIKIAQLAGQVQS